MDYSEEFKKYSIKHHGVNSLYYDKIVSSMTPYIIEERQLNVAQMDVFSRLMMDRIIFLGTGINDSIANIIQAQLLFLESTDKDKDIQIYINSPGGSVYAGLGIYDTMQFINPEVATICTGIAASMALWIKFIAEPIRSISKLPLVKVVEIDCDVASVVSTSNKCAESL